MEGRLLDAPGVRGDVDLRENGLGEEGFGLCRPCKGEETDIVLLCGEDAGPLDEFAGAEGIMPRFNDVERGNVSLFPADTVFRRITAATRGSLVVSCTGRGINRDTRGNDGEYRPVALCTGSGGTVIATNVSTRRDDKIFSRAGCEVSRSMPCNDDVEDALRVSEDSWSVRWELTEDEEIVRCRC